MMCREEQVEFFRDMGNNREVEWETHDCEGDNIDHCINLTNMEGATGEQLQQSLFEQDTDLQLRLALQDMPL